MGEAVPQLEQAVDEQEPVYVGGPVQPSSIVFLAEFLDPSLAGCWCSGASASRRPDADIDELTEATARGRVFAGYAGWGEGQLDAEVEQGDWIAHAALPEDVFTDAPGGAVEQRCSRARAAATRCSRACPPTRASTERPTRRGARGHVSGPAHASYPLSMLKLARWSTTHRKYVVLGWIVAAARRQRARPVGRHGLLEQLHAAQLRRPARGRPAAAQLPGAGGRPRHDRLSRSAAARSSTRPSARG